MWLNAQSPLPRVAVFAVTFVVATCCAGCRETPPPTAGPANNHTPSTPSPTPPAPRPTPRQAADSDWFRDVTAQSGVRFTYQSGRSAELFTLLETVGGGVAMFDYDQDGDLDLLFTGGGTLAADPPKAGGLACGLYRNEGDWRFTDVTKECELDGAIDYSHGCTIGDYDRDGFPDVYVTCYGRSRLYRNEAGKRFRDVTQECGLEFDSWSTAAVWLDIDNDGWLDLYVSGYLEWQLDPKERCGDSARGIRDVCVPQRYPPSRERLFRNQQGKFVEVTQNAGLLERGIGMGAVAADLDDDGHIDLYVANDVMQNYLYLGAEGGKLRETAATAGVAYNEFGAPEGSMGVDVGDYDGDGDLDLFVANFQMEYNALYRNEGKGLFSHATIRAGLGGASRPLVKFGTGFADFDGDGWLDLFLTNGHVLYATGISPYEQPAFVYRNTGGVFEDVSAVAAPYFTTVHAGRGAAVGDLDNDGAIDLVVVHQDQPVTLLRNRRPPQHWLGLQLAGDASNTDAVGARVSVEFKGRQLVRVVRGGGGYLSHFDSRIVVPRVDDAPSSVEVRWPGGRRERFAGLAGNRYHRLLEGRGEPTEKN